MDEVKKYSCVVQDQHWPFVFYYLAVSFKFLSSRSQRIDGNLSHPQVFHEDQESTFCSSQLSLVLIILIVPELFFSDVFSAYCQMTQVFYRTRDHPIKSIF